MPATLFDVLPPEARANRTGLELLRAMISGEFAQPPIGGVLDFEIVEAAPGLAVFEGTPRAAFYNPLGGIHGGWTATLLDSAMACAVWTNLAAGQFYTTVEFKLNCIRPITEATGRVRCEGRVVNAGRTIATSEGKLFDAGGKLLAHGTETCLIFPP